MYGGRDETKIYSDIWVYNLDNNDWKQINLSPETSLIPRFGHTAVICQDRMLIFGGWDGNQTLSDVLEFRSSTS
jgi:N-acetylneuraminic acid mutarotase